MERQKADGTFAVILGAIIFGVGARLYLAYFFHGNDDQRAYETVAAIMQRGGNVYAETRAYNYSPLWSYCLLILSHAAHLTGLPFHFLVRGFLTIIDVGNASLIGLIASTISAKHIRHSFALGFCAYLLNPVALLLTGYHGQFENFAMLPLLYATYLYCRNPAAFSIKWLCLLGALSLIIKHITIFSVWTLFLFTTSNRRAVALLFTAILIFLSTFLFHIATGSSGILANVFLYQSRPMGYGLGVLLPLKLSKLLFLSLMLALPYMAKRQLSLTQPKAMELSSVAFLTLTYGFAEQYLIMPVIWGSLFRSPWYWAYTAAATFELLGSPNNLYLPFMPSIYAIPSIVNIIWLSAAGWLLSYFLVLKTKDPESNTMPITSTGNG